MYRVCIAVVDASRARLFRYERSSEAEGLREHLSEDLDLVNPARRLRPSELFSESRPGSSRVGDLQYAFDDHRDAHVDEYDASFARLVTDEIARLLRAAPADRLVICASPHMLGAIREEGRDLAKLGVRTDELPRDLVKLSTQQLRAYLESRELLPAKPARMAR